MLILCAKLDVYMPELNTIIRKFNSALLNTKIMLFRAYRMLIYSCQLWFWMLQYFYNKLCVAYNDGFWQLSN